MLGLLGALDWRMTVISSNFVAVLLIITLAICIHLIVRYRELHAEDPDGELFQRVSLTVQLMAVPCFYTGITTVVAFVSLVVSGIQPVIDFGWMMTVGVCVALLTTFIMVPSLMLVWPQSKQHHDTGDARLDQQESSQEGSDEVSAVVGDGAQSAGPGVRFLRQQLARQRSVGRTLKRLEETGQRFDEIQVPQLRLAKCKVRPIGGIHQRGFCWFCLDTGDKQIIDCGLTPPALAGVSLDGGGIMQNHTLRLLVEGQGCSCIVSATSSRC